MSAASTRWRRAAAMAAVVIALCSCRSSSSNANAAADTSRARAKAVPADTSRGATTTDADADSTITSGPDAVTFFTAAAIDETDAALSHAGSTGKSILGQSTYRLVESRRLADGSPEIHDAWTDVTIVRAGHATLLTGGRVTGGRLVSAGEHRGGKITGGTMHPIEQGSVFVVPAGTPHQYQVARGDSIRYLTVKVPKAR